MKLKTYKFNSWSVPLDNHELVVGWSLDNDELNLSFVVVFC